MTIETYLYRSDPFRATSVVTPLPYPIKASAASNEAYAKIEPTSLVKNILARHGHDQMFLLQDVTKPGYPGGDVPVPTVRVPVYGEPPSDYQSFGQLKDELRKFLVSKGLDDIHVEVFHFELAFQPSLFSIQPDDPAVGIFEAAAESILRLLHDSPVGSAWKLLSLFKIGQTEIEATPTILVTVAPGVSLDWVTLECSIKGCLHDDLNVEFLPGSLSPLAGPSAKGVSQLLRMADDGHPEMGCSIAVRGEQGGRTMGGFVTLTKDNETRKGFLTNVVQPSVPDHIRLKADKHGSSCETPNEADAEVVFFSGHDIAATLDHSDDLIQTLRAEMEKLRERQNLCELTGAGRLPLLDERIEHYEAAISDSEKKRNFVRTMPLLLGKVGLSSGKALIRNWLHDWVFVELAEPSDRFFGPNRMPRVPENLRPDIGGIPTLLPPEGSPLKDFGELEKGGYYLKVGRTTGITAGRCNGTLAYVNWSQNDRERYNEKGNAVSITRRVTTEYVIVGHAQAEFALPGDSGSMLLNDRGEVCGLLYGEVSGYCGPPGMERCYSNAGLASSIKLVIDAIKDQTTSIDEAGNPNGAMLGLPA